MIIKCENIGRLRQSSFNQKPMVNGLVSGIRNREFWIVREFNDNFLIDTRTGYILDCCDALCDELSDWSTVHHPFSGDSPEIQFANESFYNYLKALVVDEKDDCYKELKAYGIIPKFIPESFSKIDYKSMGMDVKIDNQIVRIIDVMLLPKEVTLPLSEERWKEIEDRAIREIHDQETSLYYPTSSGQRALVIYSAFESFDRVLRKIDDDDGGGAARLISDHNLDIVRGCESRFKDRFEVLEFPR